MSKSKRIKIGLMAIAIFASSFLSFAPASATGEDMYLLKEKIALNILRECYANGQIQEKVRNGIEYSDPITYQGVSSMVSDDKMSGMYLVSQLNDDDDPKRANCLAAFKTVVPDDPAPQLNPDLPAFFEKIGYTIVGDWPYGSRIYCFRASYYFDGKENEMHYSGDICYESYDQNTNKGSGTVRNDQVLFQADTTINPFFKSFSLVEEDDKKNMVDKYIYVVQSDSSGDVVCKTTVGSLTHDGKLKQRLYSVGPGSPYHKTTCNNNITIVMDDISYTETSLPKSVMYRLLDDSDLSFKIMRKNYRPEYENEFVTMQVTPQEVYDLYIHYLISIYGVEFNATECIDEPSNNKVFTSKGWCAYPPVPPSGKEIRKVAGFTNLQNNFIGGYPDTTLGYSDLFQALYTVVTANNGIEGIEVGDDGVVIDPIPDDGGELADGEKDPCYENASSLGWLLCPLVGGISDNLQSLYTDNVKGYLSIDSFLLDAAGNNDSGSGTYQAWRVFVDFANVILVVFFIIVIFSQLTGVGIDNYGIKKALPKIIIAAVLINASFIVCQLVSDLSNIIGSSLESLLAGIGDNIAASATQLSKDSISISNGGFFQLILELTVFAAGGLAIGSFVHTGLSTSWTNAVTGLIIPLAFTLLIALLAVLFFFILLGIRKAAIVLLVAVSPIALACYMLPNAKTFIFDRWLKLFKTMIIAYPICGLLIGGSGLSSAILMSSGLSKNFLFYAISMLIMVVPFFFLPTLIKGSIGALGNITQKASNAIRGQGKKAQGKTDVAVKNSRGYQRRRELAQELQAHRRAERDVKRYAGKTSRFKWRQRAMDRRVAAGREQLVKDDALAKTRFLHQQAGWEAGKINENEINVQKEKLATDNLQDKAYVRSKQFLQAQESASTFEKTRRFGETDGNGGLTLKATTARRSLRHRLKIDRDNDAQTDKVYASQSALQAGLMGNKQRALAKRKENAAAALANNALKMHDFNRSIDLDIVTGNAGSMSAALRLGLEQLDDPNISVEDKAEIEANISVLQDEMMKSNGGRDEILSVYENLAARQVDGSGNLVGVADNSRIRTVAANFMNAYREKLKGYNIGAYSFMEDIAVAGKTIEPADSYVTKGLDKLKIKDISSLDTTYVDSLVRVTNGLPSSSAEAIMMQNLIQQYKSASNEKYRTPEITKALSGSIWY